MTSGDTCRGYVTSGLPKSCLSSRAATVEVYVRASPRCSSMALLSLCIKPLSPFSLTPRQSQSIHVRLSQPPLHLSRFHPRRFIEASTPSSAGSGRSGCLARTLTRSRASERAFPPGCIAKSIPTPRTEEENRRRVQWVVDKGEWATVAEARVVFEKGEPRHISLQTNNF